MGNILHRTLFYSLPNNLNCYLINIGEYNKRLENLQNNHHLQNYKLITFTNLLWLRELLKKHLKV